MSHMSKSPIRESCGFPSFSLSDHSKVLFMCRLPIHWLKHTLWFIIHDNMNMIHYITYLEGHDSMKFWPQLQHGFLCYWFYTKNKVAYIFLVHAVSRILYRIYLWVYIITVHTILSNISMNIFRAHLILVFGLVWTEQS